MQSNRIVALSENDLNKGHWISINELNTPNNTPVKVWLKDLDFLVFMTKQLFTNKEDSTGIRFLVCNDFSLIDDDFTTIYKKGGVLKSVIRV